MIALVMYLNKVSSEAVKVRARESSVSSPNDIVESTSCRGEDDVEPDEDGDELRESPESDSESDISITFVTFFAFGDVAFRLLIVVLFRGFVMLRFVSESCFAFEDVALRLLVVVSAGVFLILLGALFPVRLRNCFRSSDTCTEGERSCALALSIVPFRGRPRGRFGLSAACAEVAGSCAWLLLTESFRGRPRGRFGLSATCAEDGGSRA